MTRLKAAFLTLFSFAAAHGTFALLMANGLSSFDCEGLLAACRAGEMRGAVLIVSRAALAWLTVCWLLLREWVKR